MAANVLATVMRTKMQNRAGYLSINELMDEMTMYYTFKNCIKVHDDTPFVNWICYWEDSPVAVKCVVQASVLANSFTKVAIISKELVEVSSIGEYNSSKNFTKGYIHNNKFIEENKNVLQSYVNNAIINASSESTENIDIAVMNTQPANSSKKLSQYSNAEIDKFKEIMQKNWGCTFKNS